MVRFAMHVKVMGLIIVFPCERLDAIRALKCPFIMNCKLILSSLLITSSPIIYINVNVSSAAFFMISFWLVYSLPIFTSRLELAPSFPLNITILI